MVDSQWQVANCLADLIGFCGREVGALHEKCTELVAGKLRNFAAAGNALPVGLREFDQEVESLDCLAVFVSPQARRQIYRPGGKVEH